MTNQKAQKSKPNYKPTNFLIERFNVHEKSGRDARAPGEANETH